jgi:hypothetical protein
VSYNHPNNGFALRTRAALQQRVARLEWLASKELHAESIGCSFVGGLNQQLFEEARYCFVYGISFSAA